jgi:hypothetical protein
VRANALSESGCLAIWRGDYRWSVALLEESKGLFEDLEDKPGVAASLLGRLLARVTRLGEIAGPVVVIIEAGAGTGKVPGFGDRAVKGKQTREA